MIVTENQMEKFFKPKTSPSDLGNRREPPPQRSVEFNVENLVSDPGLRPAISNYDVNLQEIVRRAYLQKGPCQPSGHLFPYTQFGPKRRRFNSQWFDEYSWLEYSVEKNAAFCLWCYLFPSNHGEDRSFSVQGFSNWKLKNRLDIHVGSHNSAHNIARRKSELLMNAKSHIEVALLKQTDEVRLTYHTRLNASIDCIRFLLHQGLSFRGHDESNESSNRGNFLELLKFLADHNEDIAKVVLTNAPENLKLTAPSIQKQIVSALASEATEQIIKDIGDDFFTILVDESRDVSVREQMAIVVRYVDMDGYIIERFIGIVHVMNTSASTLKCAIDDMFAKYGLSIHKLRGQGYDGASNMSGAFNGLKSLIMRENKSAHYIHCFAHQLQLTLVAVAERHPDVCLLFESISNITNIVGVSCKRRDTLRAKELERVARGLECGEIESGQGLNQELGAKRAADTRWGSHYGVLMNFIIMFESIVDVVEIVMNDGSSDTKQRSLARVYLGIVQSFEFVFLLHLMKDLLGKTNELSQALQRKDQDIVNAMKMVKFSKDELYRIRNDDDEWRLFLKKVLSFCDKHKIEVLEMDGRFLPLGKSRRTREQVTNLHHYRFEIYNTIIDWLLNELNERFNEINIELLLCVSSLDPSDRFASFEKDKVIRLASMYPSDFSELEVMALETQLDTYIYDMRSSPEFLDVQGLRELAIKLVLQRKHQVYPLVYLVIKLALLLPVATASVERVFSAMKIIKNRLRNKMGDELMNDSLVCYIEKDVATTVTNETIIKRFQNMQNRRVAL